MKRERVLLLGASRYLVGLDRETAARALTDGAHADALAAEARVIADAGRWWRDVLAAHQVWMSRRAS